MEEKFVIIDIDEHMNFKFINHEEEIFKSNEILASKRNFSFFINAETVPASKELITIHDVPFIFPDKAYDKFDSISCEGQSIDFLPGKYSYVYFLAIGSAGNNHERFKVIFEDDSYTHIKVDFRDWYFIHATTNWKYDENNSINAIRIKMVTAGGGGFVGKDGYIYFSKVMLPSDKNIKAIELSYNPEVNIFAMTLKGWEHNEG